MSALRDSEISVRFTDRSQGPNPMMSLNPIITPVVTDQLYALLTLVTDPTKLKGLLDALVAERQQTLAEQSKLANLQSERDQIAKDRDAFERDRASGLTGLAARKSAVEMEWRQIEAAKKEHAENVQQFTADRAALEQEKRSHAEQIGEVAKLRQVLRG